MDTLQFLRNRRIYYGNGEDRLRISFIANGLEEHLGSKTISLLN